MGWFTSLFTSLDSSQRAHKGRALSSTHDAFSLPTTSPGFGGHPDAFNPEALQTPDIDSQTPSYTYPPAQNKGQYGYIASPISATSRQGSASLLPTHMPQPPLPPSHNQYPPLAHTWDRLRVWLSREYPELGDTLNYGILPEDLAEIEMHLGIQLPSAVRESYLCIDGQEPESAAACSEGLFFGLSLLPLENVLEEWRFWREVDEDSTTGANAKLQEVMQSVPPRWIRLEYSNRGWIPLIADKAGNYVGVDMNPGEEGSPGQVIIFGRDFDTKVVLYNGDGWGGWAKWLSAFADELESGEGFEIGHGDSSSEGSEDGIGYESYYHDGTGGGAGDGGGGVPSAQGGLKLTGEYRGWSVLEAWGDRSLRRWHEAGLLPEYPQEPIVTVETVDLVAPEGTDQSGAEVPIPVVAESDAGKEAAESSSAHTKSRSNAVPTISVTKPPAPQPVDLPTQSDISIPDDPLGVGNEYDLETGRGHPRMEDLQEEMALVNSNRLSQQEPLSPFLQGEAESSASAIPLSPPPPMDPPSIAAIIPVQDSSRTAAPTTVIPDLMTGEAPPLAAVPLAPSQSSSSVPEPSNELETAKAESSSEEEEEDEESSEEEDDEEEGDDEEDDEEEGEDEEDEDDDEEDEDEEDEDEEDEDEEDEDESPDDKGNDKTSPSTDGVPKTEASTAPGGGKKLAAA